MSHPVRGAAQEHAVFHSLAAELVLRIPRVAALPGAAPKSPAGQLLAAPEFEAWVRQLTGQPDFDAPKTIQDALRLGTGAAATGEETGQIEALFQHLLGAPWQASVSASVMAKGGLSGALMGLRSVPRGGLTERLMSDFHVRWVIEFPFTEDRAAWLAAASKELKSKRVCTISEQPSEDGAYQWFAGTAAPGGAGTVLEGPLRLMGDKFAIIDMGNLELLPSGELAAIVGPHPMLALPAGDENLTLAVRRSALPPITGDDPAMAPFSELLAVCLGPMLETMTFPGEIRWVAGEGTSALYAKRDKAARISVAHTPLSEDAYPLAHPEAHVAVVTSFDHDAFAKSFRALGASDEVIAFFGRAKPEMGISILPMSRGVLPQVLVAFHTSDGPATLDALLAASDEIAKATRRQIFFARAEYRGATYVTPRFKNSGVLETLVQPCIVVTEDRIFLATDAALAKREIRRLQTEATRRVHASLAAMGAPDEGVTLVACADWAGLLTDVHGRADGILKTLGPMVLGNISAEALPPLELLTGSLTPSTRWIALSDTGYTEEAHTPFGPFEFTLAGAAMASWFTVQVDEQMSAAEIAQTKADIMTIHTALQQFYLTNTYWPDRLSDLPLTTTDPRDPWGSAYRFRIDSEDKLHLWSIGPNLMNEKGDGDDISLKELMRR